MIMVLSEPGDVHAEHVLQKLQERGAPCFRFDPAQYPARAQISLALSATGEARYALTIGRDRIELNHVKAVWRRRPGFPVAHEEIREGPDRVEIENECADVLRDVWNSLDCLWAPAPRAVIDRAECKASQLKTAGALGFELPPTLISNNPADVLDFYRRNRGKVVSKLAGFSLFRTQGSAFCRYTEVVTKRDIGRVQAVRYCPMIFQAYVPKRVELRITVVGARIFAAEIHSQQTNHTRYDWRRYDFDQTRYLAHELPPEIARLCVRLVRRLGLCYGAIDMIVTPDGRYVFLELNPNGQYLWIEQKTGLPIGDALCDLLTAGAAGAPSSQETSDGRHDFSAAG